jgi:hypothetical protein
MGYSGEDGFQSLVLLLRGVARLCATVMLGGTGSPGIRSLKGLTREVIAT